MTTLEKIREEIFEKSVQMHFDGNYYIKAATITMDSETNKPIFKDSDLFEILSKYTEQEPKMGHWIHTEECDEEWQYRCSKCNMPSRSNAHRYCSNCGSYMYGMVEPQESEDKE